MAYSSMSQQREYIESVREEVKRKLLQSGFKTIRSEDTFDIFQAPENTSLQLNFANTNHDVDRVFLYATDITVVYPLPDNEEFSISMPLENIVKIDITVNKKVDYVDKNFIYNQLIEGGFKKVPKSKKQSSNKETIELTPRKDSDIVINHVNINNRVVYVTLYEYFMIVEFSNQGRKFETTIDYKDITSFNFF
jgi:hypothetical protein